MNEALAVAAAAVAWLGAALLVLSEGRRAAALALVAIGIGLATGAAAAGVDARAAGLLAAGAALAAVGRLRGGAAGWALLPPGSTPRLIASLAVPVAGALVAGSGLGGPAGLARLGALVVAVLAAGRALTVGGRWPVLAAGSALALGLGALGETQGLVAGGAVAALLGLADGAELAGATE
jgi:hypothetical protein